MKRIVLVAILAIVLCGCGGDDDPKPDITLADLDKRLDDIEDEIDTLRQDVAQGNIKVIEGAVPVDTRDPVEEVQDRTGGLPPSGEPTGEPVVDPFGGVPAFGEERIVFSRGDGIYIMASNGAGVELVVAPELGFRDPALSPNGESVVYLTLNAATMNRAGAVRHIKSGTEFIIENPGRSEFSFPAWSPDGKRIAFMGYRGKAWDIYLVNTRTFVETQVTDSQRDYVEPTWSPDGSKIAMSTGDIWTINIDGTGLTNLTNGAGGTSPDWQ